MDKQEARRFGLALMEKAEAAYLTTIDGNGFPQVRAMLNLRNRKRWPALAGIFDGHQHDLLMYFSTNTSAAKVAHIKANPKVSVYFCDPAQFHGLMLAGIVEIITDQRLKRQIWQDGWEVYYPGGVTDPDYTLLRLLPTLAKGWTGTAPFEFEL